jgi:hypothetical protein
MSLAYRSAQFARALTAHPGPEDLALADEFLPAALRPVFRRLPRPDQAHGLAVLRRLLAHGERDPDLLAAGLLHDLGKARQPLRLTERVAIVLARTVAAQASLRWGQGPPSGWRRAFVVAARHPAWGAESIRLAGGSPTLVNLILHHQVESSQPDSPSDPLLRALQRADGDS